MKNHIEIFTAGCPVCEPVVQLVKETATDNFEISIHNLSNQSEREMGIKKLTEYQIKRLPAIVVGGVLLNCCKNIEITKEDLLTAGIGAC